MAEWQPIETAPKTIVWRNGIHRYGEYFLGYANGDVRRLRWWDGNEAGETRWCNFLGDCGNAYHPSHWMPLPEPPGTAGEP